MARQKPNLLPPLAALGDAADLAKAAALAALGPERTPTEIAKSLEEAITALDASLPLLTSDAELCDFGKKTARQLIAAYTIALLEMADALRERVKSKTITTKDLISGIEALGRQLDNLRLQRGMFPGLTADLEPVGDGPQDATAAALDRQIADAKAALEKLTAPSQ